MERVTSKLLAEQEGAIGWITFNNPARRNAVSLEMWEALPAALDEFERDEAVRVIVLRGAGEKAFVSGADISQFEEQRSSPATVAHYDSLSEGAQQRLQSVTKPTIAMIRGYCIGGGVGIALCCDLRIAADDARFGIPAARLGLGYRHGGIRKLLQAVGPAYAKEILFTARRYPAAEAHHMGLVNQVVPAGELERVVRDYCATIAANAPLTIAASKWIMQEILRTPRDFDGDACDREMMRCFESEDYVEGRRAFMEKRTPRFRGR